MHDYQRMIWDQTLGHKSGKEVLVDTTHDCHEAIIAILTVGCGGKQVLDIPFVVAERSEQSLKTERAYAGVSRSDFGTNLDLARDGGKALI